jgi:hypothetical protein
MARRDRRRRLSKPKTSLERTREAESAKLERRRARRSTQPLGGYDGSPLDSRFTLALHRPDRLPTMLTYTHDIEGEVS